MSDYANKLSLISEKKNKLLEEEQKLIEKRKNEIGQLAQKFDLLTAPDELIAGIFSEAKSAIENKTDKVKEWETLGGRFRQSTKESRETQKNKRIPAEV